MAYTTSKPKDKKCGTKKGSSKPTKPMKPKGK